MMPPRITSTSRSWPAPGCTSVTCPVQAFRVGSAVYATQFHPELDAASLCTRIEVYKHAGYFEPAQAGELKARARRSNVTCPPAILRRFARRYACATTATPRPSAAVS
jgi:GMP synthase (glutamine-hydrolysing)